MEVHTARDVLVWNLGPFRGIFFKDSIYHQKMINAFEGYAFERSRVVTHRALSRHYGWIEWGKIPSKNTRYTPMCQPKWLAKVRCIKLHLYCGFLADNYFTKCFSDVIKMRSKQFVVIFVPAYERAKCIGLTIKSSSHMQNLYINHVIRIFLRS